MTFTIYLFSLFCIFSTLISLSKSVKWWIRMFDFPFAQLTVMTLFTFVSAVFLLPFDANFDYLLSFALFAVLIYQSVIVIPYTPIYPVQVQAYRQNKKGSSIKILSANVLMSNKETDKLKTLLKEQNPDIISLLETDDFWHQEMSHLATEYPYYETIPLDNTYGLLLYSRFPLKRTTVNYFVEEGVPSVDTFVELPNEDIVRLIVTHPPPPSPTEYAESAERDGELLIIARKVKDEKHPVIVVGDLNDVAWSHTTRLFQRTANLLDPRIGRGFFNTFHADYPFLRWPLDHVFHSAHFRVVSMKRLRHIGSDHFPIFIELNLELGASRVQESDETTKADIKEADEKIEYALNTPSSEIT